MNQEKYSLNWDTYSDHLRKTFYELMKSNELTDVTLVCDDRSQFKAHKIVLSACSAVFKSIIIDLPQKNSVIYLRGIQHEEMESILEYMYLGVATFYQERLNEFLNVAKNLEIKFFSISNEKPEIPDIQEYIELKTKQTNIDVKSKQSIDHLAKRTTEGMFDCTLCQKQFTKRNTLKNHIQSIHVGVKFPCNLCDYEATQHHHLKTHVETKHDSIKFSCDKCDHQLNSKDSLSKHIKYKHEGLNFACNLCDYETTQHQHLKSHVEAKHDSIKFSCDKCDHQLNSKDSLRKHQKIKHSIM